MVMVHTMPIQMTRMQGLPRAVPMSPGGSQQAGGDTWVRQAPRDWSMPYPLIDAAPRPGDEQLTFLARTCLKMIEWYQRKTRKPHLVKKGTNAIGATCGYYPSCSSYSALAIREHGAIKGCWMTLKRLLSCNCCTIKKKRSDKAKNEVAFVYNQELIYDPVR